MSQTGDFINLSIEFSWIQNGSSLSLLSTRDPERRTNEEMCKLGHFYTSIIMSHEHTSRVVHA